MTENCANYHTKFGCEQAGGKVCYHVTLEFLVDLRSHKITGIQRAYCDLTRESLSLGRNLRIEKILNSLQE